MKNKQSIDKKLIDELNKQNISDKELAIILKNLKSINPIKYTPQKIDFPEKTVKFLVFGDAHIGHMNYRPDILEKMVLDTKKQGCEFAINAGDTIEGMSNREGHIYELSHIGVSNQLDYFNKEFNKFNILGKDFIVYSIEAQNSHSGWAMNKGNQGLSVGEELERRNKYYKFIGFDEQDLVLTNGLKIRLRHPGGGTAYALCFDGVTEILTEDGWKLFKDLNKKEKVATLNLDKDQFEWQQPIDYTNEEYCGELLHFQARNIDLVVTPNHRMLVRRYPKNLENGRKEKLSYPTKSHRRIDFDWVIKKASELKDCKRQEWQMKRDVSNWNGKLLEKIFIPERKIKRFGTRQSPRIEYINIEDMAELIGWYVTEGFIKKSLIQIAQYKNVNPNNYDEIIDLFKRIGLSPKEDKRKQHINVYSIELAEWLINECGNGSRNKFLPKWLKEQPKEILEIIFETMIKGDGWINNKGFGYRTLSKRLLNDICEISHKLGYAVTYNSESLSITSIQTKPTINNKPKIIDYKGKIYCVSVPNTLILVRRNGKAIWSGNSYKIQKYIESISGGQKPEMLFEGHFHKALYLFYRNIHAYDVGSLQEQSPFMKKKGTPSHMGYWIIEAKLNKKKVKDKLIERVNNQFIPFFE